MEWKIGEIKQVNGEWYQCIKGLGCNECDLSKITCYHRFESGSCSPNMRKDGTQVIFKKLEKVGEPFTIVGTLCQHYRVFDIDNVCGDGFWCVHNYKARTLTIEIKQNKEDMEEITRSRIFQIATKYINGGVTFDEFEKAMRNWINGDKRESKPNLKPFDLEAAKAGKPVCTRDGKKARIICFDLQSIENTPIVAVVQVTDKQEVIANYYENGQQFINGISELDLMMLPEKKEGWVNIYRGQVYNTFEKAEEARKIAEHGGDNYLKTIKIDWEE